MATWTGTSTSRGIAWLGLVVFVFLLALDVALWSTSPMWVQLMTTVLAIVIPLALVVASSLRVDVTAEAFVVRWGPARWPTRTIPWSEVASVSVVEIDAWHWGGWGYRWNPSEKAWAAVVRSGPGIQLDLRDGRRFLVTVDDAATGAQAAISLLGRSG